jgi:selenide,water dikinase
VLVGFDTSDDAGVYRLNAEQAVITTADFITPPVDDPFLFGQVAAANALSDVYAMGGRPLTCINLAGFPADKLAPETLRGIIAGALSKITEAGAVMIGGHTTEDEEPKFGLAVTGVVHPDRIWRNAGAKAGDRLVLTKPIGSGVLFNANLKKWVSPEAMAACLEVITTLNKTAAEVMQRYEISGATDITGFGLAGHALEMARGSGVTLEIELAAVPLMGEAIEMYRKGMTTGVNRANRRLVGNHIRFENALPSWHQEIVMDPQTSGGLLAAVRTDQAEALLTDLHGHGVSAARLIGKVTPRSETFLVFT